MTGAPAEFLPMLLQAGLTAAGETPAFRELAGGVASDIWLADLKSGPVCVKRALAKLRVAQDWRAPVERNAYEAAWLEAARRIVPGAAPRVLARDPERHMFAMEYLDPAYCKAHGIDIVHRPTGGRAVLHDDELTYAVASNDAAYFGDTIYGNYRRVSEALCLGYNALGVPATLAPDTRKIVSWTGADPPCFISPSRYELMAGGRKIVGSAQRRVRSSFLQHGSMPITCNREALARATRIADASILEREIAGIAEFVPVRPTINAVRDALIRSFQQYFSIEFML